MYGLDPVLLDTRRLILEHAGFLVESTHTLEDFGGHTAKSVYDLWILCHSVPEDQVAELNQSGLNHKTPILQIPTLLPPDAFLNHVRQLMS